MDLPVNIMQITIKSHRTPTATLVGRLTHEVCSSTMWVRMSLMNTGTPPDSDCPNRGKNDKQKNTVYTTFFIIPYS